MIAKYGILQSINALGIVYIASSLIFKRTASPELLIFGFGLFFIIFLLNKYKKGLKFDLTILYPLWIYLPVIYYSQDIPWVAPFLGLLSLVLIESFVHYIKVFEKYQIILELLVAGVSAFYGLSPLIIALSLASIVTNRYRSLKNWKYVIWLLVALTYNVLV